MNNQRGGLLADAVFMTSLVLVGMLAAEHFDEQMRSIWVLPTENWTLGAENNSIALAIYSGRGFSDPFRTPSGPTAWMPPVYPYLLAALYWLTDFQPDAVVEIVLGLKAVSIIASGMLVIRVARTVGLAFLGYVVVPLGLAANFHDYFQTTHDVWILVFLIDLIWLGSILFWNAHCGLLRSIAWGAFGGFCALCSPVIGFAWAACFVYSACSGIRTQFTHSSRDRVIKSLLTVVFIAALSIVPWTVRNRCVLGKWVPIKSNSSFEIWQSLCIDDDGVLDLQVLRQHPWTYDGSERANYVKLGEIQFLERKWPLIIDAIRDSPWSAFRKLGNRAIASLVYYFTFRDQDAERVWPMLFKRIVFPVPFIAFLICMANGATRKTPEFYFACILYVATLTPYVLVSYYDRYSAPLLPIKLILVVLATKTCKQWASDIQLHQVAGATTGRAG